MKKATVGLVLYGTKYLDKSLPTLLNQDYPEIEYIFLDQEEGIWSAFDYIKKHHPQIKVQRGKNLWHSGGHNTIINQMTGDYYFCVSNDMLYEKDFVSKMIKALDANPEFTFATPKIMRWDYANNKKTNEIDSFGLAKTSYHHFYDLGNGQKDQGQYDKTKEVWGTSGACSVFTKKALESIRHKDEYFDSMMHYKNDVDLSFRLRNQGHKALLVHDTTVYHDRQAAKHNKKSLSIKESSFLGEKILLYKNLPQQNLQTLIYQFLKTSYLLATNPKLLKQLKKFKQLKSQITSKQKA